MPTLDSNQTAAKGPTLSFAIAVRWVYVDGQRTSYANAVDEAACLHAELVELRARAQALRASGATPPPMPALADLTTMKGEQALLDWISWARSALPPLRTQLDTAAHHALSQRLSTALPPPQTRTSAREELAELRRTEPAAPPSGPGHHSDPTTEHHRALESVRGLLTQAAPEIDPHEHTEVAARMADLEHLPPHASRATVREMRHAVEVALHAAVGRHRHHHDRERIRHRMLAETTDVASPLREQLHAEIATTEDPASLEPRLHAARTAADTDRARRTVAQAATAALAEVGCAVSPALAHTLTESGEGIVDLPEVHGYGVRVRLAPDHDQLSTTLVRYTDTTETTDTRTGHWFCREKQPALHQALHAHAHPLQLHQRLRLEPGDRPLPQVAPPVPTQHDDTHTDTTTAEPPPRQRHHP